MILYIQWCPNCKKSVPRVGGGDPGMGGGTSSPVSVPRVGGGDPHFF